MPKGVEQNALGAAGTAQGQSNNAYNVANPIYTQMATNPQGYTPQQQANMETASAQSLGGSNASAVGSGALQSARTNNAGGYQAAVDDAARSAGATQSQNTLGILNQSAALQRQQQQQGLQGLGNIYGDANKTGEGYLNEANQAAANNPYIKLLQSGFGAAGQAASAYLGNQ